MQYCQRECIVTFLLTRISGSTFTDVVFGTHWLEAHTVLTVVMLTRWGLRVQHCDHWFNFTKFSRKIGGTFARIIIHSIDTNTAILQEVIKIFRLDQLFSLYREKKRGKTELIKRGWKVTRHRWLVQSSIFVVQFVPVKPGAHSQV